MDKEEEKQLKERFQKAIGKHIRKIRLAKQIRGTDLCANIGMEKGNLYKLESGHFSPSLYLLSKISSGLGISLSELLKDFKY